MQLGWKNFLTDGTMSLDWYSSCFKDLIIVWKEVALQLKIEPAVHRIVSHIVFLIIVFF